MVVQFPNLGQTMINGKIILDTQKQSCGMCRSDQSIYNNIYGIKDKETDT